MHYFITQLLFMFYLGIYFIKKFEKKIVSDQTKLQGRWLGGANTAAKKVLSDRLY